MIQIDASPWHCPPRPCWPGSGRMVLRCCEPSGRTAPDRCRRQAGKIAPIAAGCPSGGQTSGAAQARERSRVQSPQASQRPRPACPRTRTAGALAHDRVHAEGDRAQQALVLAVVCKVSRTWLPRRAVAGSMSGIGQRAQGLTGCSPTAPAPSSGNTSSASRSSSCDSMPPARGWREALDADRLVTGRLQPLVELGQRGAG